MPSPSASAFCGCQSFPHPLRSGFGPRLLSETLLTTLSPNHPDLHQISGSGGSQTMARGLSTVCGWADRMARCLGLRMPCSQQMGVSRNRRCTQQCRGGHGQTPLSLVLPPTPLVTSNPQGSPPGTPPPSIRLSHFPTNLPVLPLGNALNGSVLGNGGKEPDLSGLLEIRGCYGAEGPCAPSTPRNHGICRKGAGLARDAARELGAQGV